MSELRLLPKRRFSVALITLTLAGCNSVYRQYVRSATDAEEKGDRVSAARYYAKACSSDPRKTEVCEKAKSVSREEHARLLALFRPACEAGDVNGCIKPLNDVEYLNPGAPETMELKERCAAAFAKSCAAQLAQAPKDAIAQMRQSLDYVRCLESAKQLKTVRAYVSELARARQQAALLFSGAVDGQTEQALPGAAYAMLSASYCLWPDQSVAEHQAAVRSIFIQRSTAPVMVQAQAKGMQTVLDASRLCREAELPSGARCQDGQPSNQPAIDLRYSIELGKTVYSKGTENATERYASSYIEVPNDEYERVSQSIGSFAQEAHRAEGSYLEAQSRCNPNDSNDASGACYEAWNAEVRFKSALSDLEREEGRLRDTPLTRQEAVWADFGYTITRHVWEAPYSVIVTAVERAGSKDWKWSGRFTYQDSEHVGFAPANLPVDPLEPPAAHYFDREMEGLVRRDIAKTVKEVLSARASNQAEACAGMKTEMERYHCQSEASLMGGVDPAAGQEVLLRLSQDSIHGTREWPVPDCGLKTASADEVGNVSGNVSKPVPFRAIAAGGSFTCGIRTDDQIVCWGNNGEGQASPPAGSFRAISAGLNHACAIRVDKRVVCWGYDDRGQVSGAPSGSFKAIAAGGGHTCGIGEDDSVACWGDNGSGQASPPTGSFEALSASLNYTCGIRTDGTVACWGGDSSGVASKALPKNAVWAIATGYRHSCGLRTNGAVECWGNNEYRQVSGRPSRSFKAISADGFHTCAIRWDGKVFCWGRNNFGQVRDAPKGSFTAIAAGAEHGCGIREDGSVVCWGDNFYGQSSPPPGP